MNPALIVLGGAWDIPDEAVDACISGCRRSLASGWAILSRGGSALDAVEASILVLEDEPVFDAGFGSHLNLDCRVECDAIVMNGATLRAGSVAALQRIRNPIRLARAVLERCPHMMLVGEGAERFARDTGLALCDPADLVRGQYVGYRDEPGVARDSDVETFRALREICQFWQNTQRRLQPAKNTVPEPYRPRRQSSSPKWGKADATTAWRPGDAGHAGGGLDGAGVAARRRAEAAALTEMARIVRPGGVVAICDEVEHSWAWMREDHADIWLGFTPEQVHEFFAAAGLEPPTLEALGRQ